MKIKNVFYKEKENLQEVLQAAAIDDHPRLLIQVFSGIVDFELISGIRETLLRLFPRAALIGATSCGEIAGGEVRESSVLISFCLFERTELQTVGFEDSRGDSFALGADIGGAFSGPPPHVLLSFATGLSINGEDYMKGINRHCLGVTIAGGLAGEPLLFDKTYVFNRDIITDQGAVAVALFGEQLKIYTRYSLDWIPLGKELRITHAEKNRVYTIEGLPATEIYERYLGQESTRYLPVMGVQFPLIKTHQKTYIAHACTGKQDDGSMSFMGNLETGSYVRFGIGDASTLLASATSHCQGLSAAAPEVIFVYSCIARKLMMKSLVDKEIQQIHRVAPTVGFFTYGEFFHLPQGNEFSNYTITMLALREGDKVGPEQERVPCPELNIEFNPVFRALTHLVNVTARELEELAGTDQLTSLYNRRSAQEQLHKEMVNSQRYRRPLSLIMFDLDYFKSINDKLGHNAGDQALVEVARIARDVIRQVDACYRWGGEEFLIITGGTNLDGALEVAERLRYEIEQAHIVDLDAVTVSIGVTQYRREDNTDTLLKRLDQALYQSKEGGRNRVSLL